MHEVVWEEEMLTFLIVPDIRSVISLDLGCLTRADVPLRYDVTTQLATGRRRNIKPDVPIEQVVYS